MRLFLHTTISVHSQIFATFSFGKKQTSRKKIWMSLSNIEIDYDERKKEN